VLDNPLFKNLGGKKDQNLMKNLVEHLTTKDKPKPIPLHYRRRQPQSLALKMLYLDLEESTTEDEFLVCANCGVRSADVEKIPILEHVMPCCTSCYLEG
jgi:hypothetical protein